MTKVLFVFWLSYYCMLFCSVTIHCTYALMFSLNPFKLHRQRQKANVVEQRLTFLSTRAYIHLPSVAHL
ncbi:hypothetical protein KUCAC02_023853 [Chaenocephalus aceratus]|uniref:Uncharacterized protein n=1 Tax=Chaenocephalus aceratus TaxID=36190 RepID=A0ACB9WG57_CHAAC|nr:hypothetical protein KUCAC02_023853 [Chaenocephalus aceratus]